MSNIETPLFTREDLGGFKELKGLAQISEINNLEWKEWKEEGIKITNK